MESNRFKNILQDTGIYSGGPKIVAIGGGTGLSVLLRGLKRYTSNITAVVAVSDDGGGSGVLREDMGILPPGDIRNCILALANTEPIMEKLMQYRFKEGSLKGQSFGNLIIAAMNEICGSFDVAVKEISNVLAVTGQVLPVTLDNCILYAELENGAVIKGESQIPIKQKTINSKIKRVFMEPTECSPLPEAIKAIEDADAIILGPGSLYTSIIPNLIVRDIAESISCSKGIKIYVSNIMTQQGESIGYSLSDHINEINNHAQKLVVQYAIANSGQIPQYLLEKYKTEDAAPVVNDYNRLAELGIKTIEGDFTSFDKGYIRHNFNALAQCIIELVSEKKLQKDKKRILDYYFVNGKLKKIRKDANTQFDYRGEY